MEFQAIVLAAGPGSRMTDLTTQTPKALLPVANLPMVWYPVNMLQKAGFRDAIVVVSETHKADIQKSLEEICQVKMSLDFVTIPDGEDWGTADSLRHISHKIKTDMLIVSCDLITDVRLHLLADLHRTNDSTITALMAPLTDTTEAQAPGGKSSRKVERDYIGLDEHGTRLLFLSSEADIEENISFRQSFLRNHPFVSLRSDLLDAHLYLMKKQILDFLKEEPEISTIKGELLPKIVRRQFTSRPTEEQAEDLSHSPPMEDMFSKFASEMSTHPKANESISDFKCYVHVLEGGFCMRSNNVMMFCEANKQTPRHLSQISAESPFQSVHPSVMISKSTVGGDSIVGEGTTIGERVAVKKSVIGRHCIIKDKVKLSNSIVLDHTTIEEGCTLSGSVVCQNVEIGEKCEIKDTLIAAGQHINPMGKYTNEAIIELDRMMEIE